MGSNEKRVTKLEVTSHESRVTRGDHPSPVTRHPSPFQRYATVYDLLYKDKDYEKEAQHIVEILQKYGVNPGSSILNLGCGTGRHDHILAQMGYKMTGVDMSEEMVRIAREVTSNESRVTRENNSSPVTRHPSPVTRHPSPNFLQGDIRTLNLNKSFDTVISLFHVMSYQNSDEDVTAVFNNVYRHLNKNGIFVFDCWYADAVLAERPERRVKVVENDELLVTRYAKPEMHEDIHIVDVNYEIQVTEKTTGITETFHETHNMRYFSVNEITKFAQNAGFEKIGRASCRERV